MAPMKPMMAQDSFVKRLRGREKLFGAWTSLGHPSITEAFAATTVDFLGIDLEHSTISQEQAQRLIAAAQSRDVAALPRVASHNGEQIRRVLDSGADGVIVPNVTTREEIERLVAWCKYPPVGQRGYGMARAHGYGFDFDEYTATWNARSSLIIQIETVKGVEASDALVAHPAVDAAMIGPYDISGSLGLPGQLEHPRVTQACAGVIEACRRHRKSCGIHLVDPTPERVEATFAAGYTFVVLASDVFLLWKWGERMRAMMGAMRSRTPRRARSALAKHR